MHRRVSRRGPTARAALSDTLAAIGDLERLLGRIAGRAAGARDFLTLATALRAIPEIETILDSLDPRSGDATSANHAPSIPPLPSQWERGVGG